MKEGREKKKMKKDSNTCAGPKQIVSPREGHGTGGALASLVKKEKRIGKKHCVPILKASLLIQEGCQPEGGKKRLRQSVKKFTQNANHSV